MATIKKRTWTNVKGEKKQGWVLAFTDKEGKRHREQFPAQSLAKDRLAEVLSQIDKNVFKAEAKVKTVNDAADRYIEKIEGELKAREITKVFVEGMRGHLKNHVRPLLGKVKLADLTTGQIEEWRDDLRRNDKSVATVRKALSALYRSLKAAISAGWLAVNVCAGIEVKAPRGEDNRKVVPPTKEEFAAIIAAAEKRSDFRRRFKSFVALRVRFAARTGLRASEQWALRWRHLDLENALVNVSERVDAWGNIDTTKSKAGTRAVPISENLVADLKAYREVSKYPADSDFVFPDAEGGPMRHTNHLKRVWDPLLEETGLDIGWHGLRHYAVSSWIAGGHDLFEVSKFAGHAALAVTTDRYGHLVPSKKHHSIMDKIDE